MKSLAYTLMKLLARSWNRDFSAASSSKLEPCLIARGGKISVGRDSHIRFGSVLIPGGGEISIGARTTINHFAVLHGENSIRIGDNCLIAPRVSIFASMHEFLDARLLIREQGMRRSSGIVIGDDVWLGTGVVVVDGVKIGLGAVVGAGAVVTKDIPDYAVAVGIPARVIRYRGDFSI